MWKVNHFKRDHYGCQRCHVLYLFLRISIELSRAAFPFGIGHDQIPILFLRWYRLQLSLYVQQLYMPYVMLIVKESDWLPVFQIFYSLGITEVLLLESWLVEASSQPHWLGCSSSSNPGNLLFFRDYLYTRIYIDLILYVHSCEYNYTATVF